MLRCESSIYYFEYKRFIAICTMIKSSSQKTNLFLNSAKNEKDRE